MKKEKISLYEIFYLFIFGCIFGWFVEGIWTLLKKGVIRNHSALVLGPFNIIYGLGSIALTIALYNNKKENIIKLFFKGLLTGTILEYIASLYMEYTLGFIAWNYSAKFMNLNGRICLAYSIFWGILGIIWIKVIYPMVNNIISKIPKTIGLKLVKIISIFLIFDLALTNAAVIRGKEFDKGNPPNNKFEEILDNYFGVEYLNNMYNNRWNKK